MRSRPSATSTEPRRGDTKGAGATPARAGPGPEWSNGGVTPATSGPGAPYPTRLFWDPALLEYNFGDHHPMHPSRLEATYRLQRGEALYSSVVVRFTGRVYANHQFT